MGDHLRSSKNKINNFFEEEEKQANFSVHALPSNISEKTCPFCFSHNDQGLCYELSVSYLAKLFEQVLPGAMDETNPYINKASSNTDLTNVISPSNKMREAAENMVPKPLRLLFPAIDTTSKYEAKLLTDPMFLFAPIALCAECFAKLIEGRDDYMENNELEDSCVL